MTKKSKIMLGTIAVLAAALLVQTGYLVGSRDKKDVSKVDSGIHQTPLDKGVPQPQRSYVAPMARGQIQYGAQNSQPFSRRYDWDPFEEMARMHASMNRMFNDAFAPSISGSSWSQPVGANYYQPDLDVTEQDGYYLAELDLPGIEKDQIEIKVHEHALTISGQRNFENEVNDETEGFYRYERSSGSFARTIPLPEDATRTGIKADIKDGVLTVKIPKKPKDSQAATIDVPIQS